MNLKTSMQLNLGDLVENQKAMPRENHQGETEPLEGVQLQKQSRYQRYKKSYKEYVKKNKPWLKTAARKWAVNNSDRVKFLFKRHADKVKVSGNREKAITRDGSKCVLCGMGRGEHYLKYKRDITVDHIDGNGRNSKIKNNNLNNLQTLCLRCHGKKDNRYAKQQRLKSSGG